MKPTSLAELSRLPQSALGHLQGAEGALRLPHDRSVAVLRYDDVAAALSNPELTVRTRFRPTLRLFGPTIFDTDGCEHRRQWPPAVEHDEVEQSSAGVVQLAPQMTPHVHLREPRRLGRPNDRS